MIYVLGSRASGEAHAGSDSDLAVLAHRKLDAVERWRVHERVAAGLKKDLDLVDLRSASTVLQLQAVAHGRVLDERGPVAREIFDDTVFVACARLNESRRGILEDARARGRVYG